VRLHAHGVGVDLPAGWSGRLFSRRAGLATLHAASYPLALDDGEFGDASTGGMRAGACFIALTEYQEGQGLRPGGGLFSRHRIELPLDPARFAVRALAHPRPGQVGSQQFMTLEGRPFCLYVVLAGERRLRRRQLASVDHVLRSLHIARRPA
jgi:hypothetical protein